MPNRFKCSECGKLFPRPQDLGVHLRKTHNIPGSSKSSQSKYAKKAKEAKEAKEAKGAKGPKGPRQTKSEFALDLMEKIKAKLLDSPNGISKSDLGHGFNSRSRLTPADFRALLARLESEGFSFSKKVPGKVGRAAEIWYPSATASAADLKVKDPAPIDPNHPNRCPECGKESKNPSLLGVHRRVVHGVKGKSKASVRQQILQNPTKERIINPDRPFACPDCPRSFATQGYLQNHRSRVHANAPTTVALIKKGDSNGLNGIYSPTSSQTQTGEHISPEEANQAVQYAIIVGSFEERCRHIAEEQGFVTREFTRGCAEFFYRKTRR